MTQGHISTVPTERVPGAGCYVDLDGLCHCEPQPESSPIGECPRCKRLDARKAFA